MYNILKLCCQYKHYIQIDTGGAHAPHLQTAKVPICVQIFTK